jgi:hypothetical protein
VLKNPWVPAAYFLGGVMGSEPTKRLNDRTNGLPVLITVDKDTFLVLLNPLIFNSFNI